MSTTYEMKAYGDAQLLNIFNNMEKNHRQHTAAGSSKLVKAFRAMKNWFYLPGFTDLYEAQRRCASASELNSVYEKWGR